MAASGVAWLRAKSARIAEGLVGRDQQGSTFISCTISLSEVSQLFARRNISFRVTSSPNAIPLILGVVAQMASGPVTRRGRRRHPSHPKAQRYLTGYRKPLAHDESHPPSACSKRAFYGPPPLQRA